MPIYLGRVEDLGLLIMNPENTTAYAQAYMNMSDYENLSQAWSKSYKYNGRNYTGRLRGMSKSELIGDGSYTIESLMAGKPNIRKYQDFLREVQIPISKIQWTLNGKSEDIIEAKKALPFFKTNVRLANVQR